MPNIKKTAKNILYICKRWIAGKLYIISVWTKDKIAEIKSEGIKGIVEKLWMFQKKTNNLGNGYSDYIDCRNYYNCYTLSKIWGG